MLRRFNTFFDRPSTIYLLIAGYVVAAVLQGIAFSALIGFLRAFLGPDPSRAWGPMWVLIGFGAASFVVQAATLIRANRVSAYDVCGNAVARIGSRVVRLPLGWFDSGSVGRVSSAISTETDNLSHLAPVVLPQFISGIVTPLTVMVVTFCYEWRLGLIMALVVPVVVLLWNWASRLLMTEHQEAPAIAARTASATIEHAHLQPVLRAQGISGTAWPPLAKALDDENRGLDAIMTAQGRPAIAFGLLGQAFFAAVLAAGLGVVLGGGLDVAAFVAIGVMAARFTTPISQSVFYAAALQQDMVSLDTIEQIVQTPALPEPAHPRHPSGTGIVLDDVGFGYEADDTLFEHLSLRADEGRITALVGPSGCGKSTIVKLIARFWDVDSGSISVGGVDVRRIDSAELMGMVSMVFQDVYLFDTTIAENVRLSRPDASEAELAAAISRAGLEALVAALPDGLDTRVGEGGLRLSGGERQRVSIARAFLKDSPILLLDEITSALDAENESAITQTLAELAAGRTVVVIAHRLSTIMNADQVYVLSGREHGGPTRIVEQGSPAELAAGDGMFAALVQDFWRTARWSVR